MLQVTNNQIKLTAGDTASIEITIFTSYSDLDDINIPIEEQIYTLQEGDIMKFVLLDLNRDGLPVHSNFTDLYNQYISKNYRNLTNPPVLIKEFTDNIVQLDSVDTKYLNTGTYTYGVVLITADGQVNTVQQGEFILTTGFL